MPPPDEHDSPTTAQLARDPDGAGPHRVLRIFGDGIYVVVPLPEAGALTIGRGGDCDVVINERSISRHHAVLRVGAELALEDAGSANGTRVGNRTLASGEAARLVPGEIVQLGALFAAVELPDPPGPPDAPQGARMPQDAPASPDEPATADLSGAVPAGLHARIDELERKSILDALAACGGNQSETARRLGISRSTLIARLERYGVPRPRK